MAAMTNKRKVVAIIPARGGSKGIPLKNLVPLAGKPLIQWTIEAARNSRFIDEIYVSSDSQTILECAAQSGARIILRPDELARDETLTVPVLQHTLAVLEEQGHVFDDMILLQPTSPLRTSEHIDVAFQCFYTADASSLISVVEPDHSPLKSFTVENGFLNGIVNNQYPFSRRQDLPKTYLANGAIYIIHVEAFKKTGSLMTERCIPFIMDASSSIDIDGNADLAIAEELLVPHS
jgi:N-acylneuraminate cytidylyltransferase